MCLIEKCLHIPDWDVFACTMCSCNMQYVVIDTAHKDMQQRWSHTLEHWTWLVKNLLYFHLWFCSSWHVGNMFGLSTLISLKIHHTSEAMPGWECFFFIFLFPMLLHCPIVLKPNGSYFDHTSTTISAKWQVFGAPTVWASPCSPALFMYVQKYKCAG